MVHLTTGERDGTVDALHEAIAIEAIDLQTRALATSARQAGEQRPGEQRPGEQRPGEQRPGEQRPGELGGEMVSLVATFEMARPHYVRLRAGATEPLEAHELAPGERVAAPLAERERAELDADSHGLWLRRRDAIGDAIGAPELVAAGRVGAATLVRVERTLLVAYERDGALLVRTVSCAR
jgi:hypothetical protein